MTYEIIRMPTYNTELTKVLEEYTPFLDAMYTENDRAIFGDVNFLLDHWLMLWDTGAGYFVTKRDSTNKLVSLAMVTHYRDIWHGKLRLDIHRVSISDDDGLDGRSEVESLVEYLKTVHSLLRFELLYYCHRDDNGGEYKELIWKK